VCGGPDGRRRRRSRPPWSSGDARGDRAGLRRSAACGELRELFALADEQPLPDLPIVERPLADADAALSDLRAGRVRGRIVLVA
jgi:hypothetical protein